MSNHLNVCVAKTGSDGKDYFTKVGAAFRGKEDGKYAYRIVLDALPLNGELILFEPKERNQSET